MKTVNKVSINGISFTLEAEAYDLLTKYLNTLKNHYIKNPNGNEIIDGIEARIAELLLDKVGNDGVVSETVAGDVLTVIGKPEEIFGDPDGIPQETSTVKKKLYRNPDDKRIAGVIGGIAAYFGIDTIWPRLIFASITILAACTAEGFWNPSYFFLAYVILWICMPMAKSNQEKCEMKGEALSCNGIQKEVEERAVQGKVSSKGSDAVSVLGKIILICIGAFFAMIGLCGLLGIFAAIFGIAIAGLALPDLFSSLFAATGSMPHWSLFAIKLCTIILVFLPCIALLYAGIRLIFNIKSPKCKPGLIMFIVWILSLIGICFFGISATRNYWNSDKSMASETIDEKIDTLYVKLVDIEKWNNCPVFAKGDFDEYTLAFLDASNQKEMKVVVYPTIELDREDYQAPHMEVTSEYFSRAMSPSELASARRPDFYRLEGDTLFVSPVIFGGGYGIKHSEMNIEVTLPRTKKLVITGPRPHEFDIEFHESDIPEKIFFK